MTTLSETTPTLRLMRKLGMEPDLWQVEVFTSQRQRLILNCCRQAGKSTVVGLLALTEAIWNAGTLVLLVSRSLRQSTLLYRIVTGFYERLGRLHLDRQTKGELTLKNGSRIICLPCKEETIRGYSNVSLLILDEASRVPDDLYLAVRPMLAVSRGRMICLSTPYGKRGFFYEVWTHGGADWQRVEVPASQIPRITPEFLDQERRAMSESFFKQEYCCSFETLEGLVYPDLVSCIATVPAPPLRQLLGGMDFGYRNPFAAIWGGLDRDDVLWLTHEHYVRQQPLSFHAARLPRDVVWSADPSGAAEQAELRRGGFKIYPAPNAIRAGISAVQSRIRQGTLKIIAGSCPNLLAEAGLYRYADGPRHTGSEQPLGEHDHALDALRYLIARLDQHRQALPTAPDTPLVIEQPPSPPRIAGCDFNNPDIWSSS